MPKVLLILGYLMASQSFAESAGEITFSGSIIEETNCQVITLDNTVKLDCFNNGEFAATSEIISHSQLDYLDNDKNLAVMQLNYY